MSVIIIDLEDPAPVAYVSDILPLCAELSSANTAEVTIDPQSESIIIDLLN